MDLCNVLVSGYKRFRDPANLQTNGKLVAVLGPNEAGKSSLLGAIAHLDWDGAPNAAELSRGSPSSAFLIEGRFYPSEQDLEAAGLASPFWFYVTKRADGVRSFRIEPSPPARDISARLQLRDALLIMEQDPKLMEKVDLAAPNAVAAKAGTAETLSMDDEDLSESRIAEAEAYFRAILPALPKKGEASQRKVALALEEFVSSERLPNPTRRALEVFRGRLPRILTFDEDARSLQSEYNITELSKSVPAALDNLFDVADLDVDELVDAHVRGAIPELSTIEHAANAKLSEKFEESWKQSGVRVSIRIQTDQLLVQVVNERFEFTSFAERSDGLRQFVALQAFSTCNWAGKPIILVDEADQKLHYDAQADLVQMLARQQVCSKVIYTTHSAGCLPEDLGNGVRFARPSESDETRSEIRNKFWASNEAGFAPLLFGMGASTLAFFPTRNAVMVEGPSDMLLLPTMFRDALGLDVLGFQFVPGLSITNEIFHSPLLGHQLGVLYLTDGDGGGIKLRDALRAGGISQDNIFMLKTSDNAAVEFEDFVDPVILVDAANRVLAKYHSNAKSIDIKQLASKRRMTSLEAVFKEAAKSTLQKVPLAYEILDILHEQPHRSVLDVKRRKTFANVANDIFRRFTVLKQ